MPVNLGFNCRAVSPPVRHLFSIPCKSARGFYSNVFGEPTFGFSSLEIDGCTPIEGADPNPKTQLSTEHLHSLPVGEHFGIRRLLLEGGGHIKGAFLQADLVDKVSLLLVPGIGGRHEIPSVFDGVKPTSETAVPLKLKSLFFVPGIGTIQGFCASR